MYLKLKNRKALEIYLHGRTGHIAYFSRRTKSGDSALLYLYTIAFVGSSSRLISCRQMDEMKNDRIYVTHFRYVPTAYIYIGCHLGAKYMKIESGVENILLR
jgi:hypothetical protein